MGRTASGAIREDRVIQKQRNGDRYVYDRKSKYSPEKGYYVTVSSVCVGKMKPGSDDKYDLEPLRPKAAKSARSTNTVCTVSEKRRHIGMLDIVRFISEKSGVEDELNSVIEGNDGLIQKILTLAWYSFATDGKSWPGISSWSLKYNDQIPYQSTNITRDMYHDVFVAISKDERIKQGIFLKRAEAADGCKLIALTSTTLAVETKRSGKCRVTKDKDGTWNKIVKIVFFYAIDTRRPIAFSIIPGNISDSQTVSYAIGQLKGLPLDDAELIDDNGYCTDGTICEMLLDHRHFVTRIEADISWVASEIEKYRDELEHGGEIVECDAKFSGKKVQVKRTFTKRGRKKDGETTSVTKEVNVFIFFSSVNKAKDDACFRETFMSYATDLKLGKALGEERDKIEAFAQKYMIIDRDENGIIRKITTNRANYDKKLKYSGYLVIITDQEEDMNSALLKFRKREYIEEMIKNDEGHIGGKKTRVWDDDTMDGQLLVEFEALSMHEAFESKVNYMKKTLALPTGDNEHDRAENIRIERELKKWVEKTSLHDILEWFDVIEHVELKSNEKSIEWTTSASKRDQLFLQKLGIKEQETIEKS